jgi:hypothetical protein
MCGARPQLQQADEASNRIVAPRSPAVPLPASRPAALQTWMPLLTKTPPPATPGALRHVPACVWRRRSNKETTKILKFYARRRQPAMPGSALLLHQRHCCNTLTCV